MSLNCTLIMNGMVCKFYPNKAVKNMTGPLPQLVRVNHWAPSSLTPFTHPHHNLTPVGGQTFNLLGYRNFSHGAQTPNLEKTRNDQPPTLLLAEVVPAIAVYAASVTGQPRGERRPSPGNNSSKIKSAVCLMCLLYLYHGSLCLVSHSFRTNLTGLGSQLINGCVNKTQVWPSHDELHCLNELNSCIKKRKHRKSI